MQVSEVHGDDVTCLIKNSATLSGSLYTLHVSQIRIDLPTLTDQDKKVSIWYTQENVLTKNVVELVSYFWSLRKNDLIL